MYDQDLLRLLHATRYYLSCTCCIFLCIRLSDKCLKSWVCMCLCSPSARFTQDGCDQRLQWHPLSAVWAPTKHSCGGCHWTDVCRPAQHLVAGGCHSAHLRFYLNICDSEKTACHGSPAWLSARKAFAVSRVWSRAACHRFSLTCCTSFYPIKALKLTGWHQQFISFGRYCL